MEAFEFRLKFSLADPIDNPDDFIGLLGDAGCTDALIGVGEIGRIALDFCREANSATDAVISALKEVMSVIPDAKLIEATPDLVGISDIASLIGVSRQNIRKVMLNNLSTFPPPIHEGKSSIWHLENVLRWFDVGNRRNVDPQLIDIAYVNKQLNLAKENTGFDPIIQSELEKVFV